MARSKAYYKAYLTKAELLSFRVMHNMLLWLHFSKGRLQLIISSISLGVNARGCRPTTSSRWRRTISSPRQVTGNFTDTAHLLETHTYWGYCHGYEEHWGGVSSRDRQPISRDSNLKSCVVTRVMHISVFLVSRVTVFHVEGDATVDEGDACFNWSNGDGHITLSFQKQGVAVNVICWQWFIMLKCIRCE